MGATTTGTEGTTARGGRWTAVYSLWTYIHRVLHVLGMEAVDKEEVQLLSAPLVRLRLIRRWTQPRVLAHAPSTQHPDEPVGWVEPSYAAFEATLFLLHFETSGDGGTENDRARLATAAATHATPRSWLVVDAASGRVSLAATEASATIFEIRRVNGGNGGRIALRVSCGAGNFLGVDGRTQRARVCATDVGDGAALQVDHLPLPPTLGLGDHPPADPTMAAAFSQPRVAAVRIQSVARGFFLSSKPGAFVAAASGRGDAGWDVFVLEYDSFTRTTRLRDSAGHYLRFNPALDGLIGADAATDGTQHQHQKTDPHKRDHDRGNGSSTMVPEFRNAERFEVARTGDDDHVTLKSRKGFVSARRGGRVTLSCDTHASVRERFALRLALPSQTGERSPRLRVRALSHGVRQVDGTIIVPASAAIAYAVLTDYDHFCEFVEDASESKLLERRSSSELTVRMVQCHSFLMLTIPMAMTLDVTEDGEGFSVEMRLISGLGVRHYHGVWKAIALADGRARISCTLAAAPAVPAPGFLVDGLMSHALASTLAQLREECIRREGTLRSSGTPDKKVSNGR